MPWTNIAVLCAIVATFGTFAAALGYAQYQTRHIDRGPKETTAPEMPADKGERKLAA
jgi:hypothetical protein